MSQKVKDNDTAERFIAFTGSSVGGGGGSWTLASETRYLDDGKRVVQERDSSNTPTVRYTRGKDLSGSLEGAGGIGGLLARSSGYSGGSWTTHNFYHADGNGNVTYLMNSSQAMAAGYKYDPYGRTISASGRLAAANVYRYSSKEIHPNSGMYYYLFRFYDPGTQRWVNRDPLGDEAFLTIYSRGKSASERESLREQSLALQEYGFAGNQPRDVVDPLGLELKLPVSVPKCDELTLAIKHYNDACKKGGSPSDIDCHTTCDAFYGNVQEWLVAICMNRCSDCELGRWSKKNPPPVKSPPKKNPPPKESPPPKTNPPAKPPRAR